VSRLVLLAFVGLSAGCAGVSGAMATVPPEWRDTNPWSPAAHQARARGDLVPLFYTDAMARDQAWAREHLQPGDILFRRGDSRRLRDRVNDAVQMGLSDSNVNHAGVVCRVGDAVWVYDAQPNPERIRKIPFEFWMLETVPGTLVVKRPRRESQPAVPAALAYCEQAWCRQPPFDWALNLDDARLYCTELIEKAFRAGGVALSDPVMPRCLPNWPWFRPLGWLAAVFTEIKTDHPAFAPGNAAFGLYGSPHLETVCGDTTRDRHKPPVCPPTPFPPGAAVPGSPG